MLEIKNLSIIIDSKTVIENLSFVLNKGDKLAVIGEEGNGKSTLLKALVGLCPYATVTGKIDTHNHKIGYLKQFFDREELEKTVFAYLFKSEEDYYQKIKRFYQLLSQLKLEDTIVKQVFQQLSGGEKVKIGILNLLLEDCDLLLLDEPTNDLDIETLIWLENWINQTDIPLLYISHDETLLSHTANMILHLELWKKKTECKHTLLRENYDQYLEIRFSKLSKQTQVARFEKKEYEKEVAKLTELKQKVDYQLNTITRADPHGAKMLKRKMKQIKSQERRMDQKELTEVPDVEEQIHLVFEDITIPKRKQILDLELPVLKVENKVLIEGIKLQVIGNPHIVIIGKNGVGKTTLLKQIYDQLKRRPDIKVGYMPQSYDEFMSNYTNPLTFLAPHGDKETLARVRMYMGNLNITRTEMTCEITSLSGGTKAKLFLLKLVLDKNDVLLLDEPTRNLSPLSNPLIRASLKNFQGTIISISHDRKYIEEVGTIVYELTKTGLIEQYIEKEGNH